MGLLTKIAPANVMESLSGSSAKGKPQQNAISEAGEKLWAHLSADLRSDPTNHWEHALDTAAELTQSVCGQKIPEDLQADILSNLDLLEKTLTGLKLSSSDAMPDPHTHIQKEFLGFRSNVLTTPEQIQELTRIRDESTEKVKD